MPLLSARRAAAINGQIGSGALRVALADALLRLPPRPILLDVCTAHLAAHGNAKTDEALCVRAFLKLRQALLEGAPRSPELQLLWRHVVASAHYAARIAAALSQNVKDVAVAALLHRAGDMRVLAAITRAETGCAEKFDDAARGGLRAQHGESAVQRLLNAWAIAPAVIADVLAWRTAANEAAPTSTAVVVRAAHFLATRHALPENAPPGLDQAARAELKLASALIAAAENDNDSLTRLLSRVA